MTRLIGPFLILLVGIAVLWWSYADARDLERRLPVIPVRGAKFTEATKASARASSEDGAVDPATETFPGDGSAASPFEIPFRVFEFASYDPPALRTSSEPLAAGEFPLAAGRFHDRFVRLDGYQIAVDFDGERLKTFILSRYPAGCCFGAVPVMDEWVDVHVSDDEATDGIGATYGKVRVTGRLEIGEAIGDGGEVQSLYRIRDAKAEALW